MLGLLAKIVLGVAFAGGVGAAVYGVYKLVTRDTIKEEVNEKIHEDDKFKDAFKAKVKKKSENNETVTVDILDDMDEPLGDIDISGDEISSDIQVGEEIILMNAY